MSRRRCCKLLKFQYDFGMPGVEFLFHVEPLPVIRIQGVGALRPGRGPAPEVRSRLNKVGISCRSGVTDDHLRLLAALALAHREGHGVVTLEELRWLGWRGYGLRSVATIVSRCLWARETINLASGWGPDGGLVQCQLHGHHTLRSVGPYRWNPAYQIQMDDGGARALLALPPGTYPAILDQVRGMTADAVLATADAYIQAGREVQASMLYAAFDLCAGESTPEALREAELGHARVLMQLGASTQASRSGKRFFSRWSQEMDIVSAAEAVHVRALAVRQQGRSEQSIALGREVVEMVRNRTVDRHSVAWRRIWDYRLSLGVAYSHMAVHRIPRGRLFILPGTTPPEWTRSKQILRRCLRDIRRNDAHPEAEHLTAHVLMRLAALALMKWNMDDDDEEVVASALAARGALSIPGQAILDRLYLSDRLSRGTDPGALVALEQLRANGLARGYTHQVDVIDKIIGRVRRSGPLR